MGGSKSFGVLNCKAMVVTTSGSPPPDKTPAREHVCNCKHAHAAVRVWALIMKQPTMSYDFVSVLLHVHYIRGGRHNMWGDELLGGGLRSPTVVLVLLMLLSL